MANKIFRTLTLALITFSLLLLTSCGPKRIGFGVLLWSPDEEILPTGSFLNIYEESRIKGTYKAGRPGEDENIDFETWRIQIFANEAKGREFAKTYEEYNQTYGIASKQGLPLREEESASSERVYKLRDGQNIKIISRSAEEVNLGSLTGYWYKVLTEDGVEGYCFDKYLTVYNMNDAAERVFVEEEEEISPQLQNLFNHTWRPKEYWDMLTKNTIDLTKFKAHYGLTINNDTKTIRVTMPEYSTTETYEKISNIGYKRYFFEGSSFQITITSDTFISAEFTAQDKQHAQAFVLLGQSVEDYIANERNRRYQLYQEFMERGTVLKSSTYGSIILNMNQKFQWENHNTLMEAGVLAPDSQGSGTISFSRFLTPQLKQNYDGAVTFAFQKESGAQELTFLYSLTTRGLQLIHVTDTNIEEMLIQRETLYEPLVIFFTFSET